MKKYDARKFLHFLFAFYRMPQWHQTIRLSGIEWVTGELKTGLSVFLCGESKDDWRQRSVSRLSSLCCPVKSSRREPESKHVAWRSDNVKHQCCWFEPGSNQQHHIPIEEHCPNVSGSRFCVADSNRVRISNMGTPIFFCGGGRSVGRSQLTVKMRHLMKAQESIGSREYRNGKPLAEKKTH